MQDISEETIKQASDGDEEAFSQIYRQTSGFVYNVAFRFAGNREDAQEITQDVFVKIFRKLSGYRSESTLKTWIYTITVNSAINHLRKKKRRDDKQVPYDDALYKGQVSQTSGPKTGPYEHEQILESLLKVLNPEQRACIILRNIEGLTYQEIAESLDININTVRSRLKRARQRLLAHKREVMER